MRRAVLHLVLGIVALDALAMGVYYLGGIDHGTARTRMTFTVIWTVSTALVVATLLKRVRALRYREYFSKNAFLALATLGATIAWQ